LEEGARDFANPAISGEVAVYSGRRSGEQRKEMIQIGSGRIWPKKKIPFLF
jgi:hypothetical protein